MEEAKTLLSQAKAPDSSTLDADWTEPLFSASTIALVNSDNSMSRYYLCNLDGRDYLVTPAQLNAEKYTPVAVFSQDAGVVESALAALAQQQSERNASTWRVEYPEFKNQLTELFLSVEECVLLNQSEDYDMEEWLTKYTSYYNIFTVQGTAASRVFFRIVAKAVRMRESWPDVHLQGPLRP